MRAANRVGALIALILGENELAEGQVMVKDMREGGEQKTVSLHEVLDTVHALLPSVRAMARAEG